MDLKEEQHAVIKHIKATQIILVSVLLLKQCKLVYFLMRFGFNTLEAKLIMEVNVDRMGCLL